ncbi:hypothetical protein [Streptomyces sp. NPDC091215]|uniref:hypothetical protein n=1 Tax=Streptomyces sp. NPDC091215 TaxID=3155192 RepID=UPI00343702BA
MPDTPVRFIGTGLRFISWEVAHTEFMQLAYDRLVVNGVTQYIVLDPMHDMDAVSDVHEDAHYGALAAHLSACPDIDRVYIKDPGGHY